MRAASAPLGAMQARIARAIAQVSARAMAVSLGAKVAGGAN